MFAKPLVTCPSCGMSTLIKLISAGAAAIVKGTENPCRGRRGDNQSKKPRVKSKSDIKSEKPFWRDGPVNKKILKNPERYIEEGKT